MKIILYLMGLFLLISCHSTIDNDYKCYKTFDEYRLKGMGACSRYLNYTYVMVHETKDTIIVIPSTDKKRKIVYVKHKNYWYNFEHQHGDAMPGTKSEAFDRYINKYIYNDTLWVASYEIVGSYQSTTEIDVETKQENINILTNEIKTYDFAEIQYFARNYKSLFHRYEYQSDFRHDSYYMAYRKEIIGKKIYYHLESSKRNNMTEISDMGDFGEFGISCYGLNKSRSR